MQKIRDFSNGQADMQAITQQIMQTFMYMEPPLASTKHELTNKSKDDISCLAFSTN